MALRSTMPTGHLPFVLLLEAVVVVKSAAVPLPEELLAAAGVTVSRIKTRKIMSFVRYNDNIMIINIHIYSWY